MRPRLREIVGYVASDDGILFRAGDAFLPIKGRGVFELFNRLRPFLDGRWDMDQLLAPMAQGHRDVVKTLLQGLMAADMLYDAREDDPDRLPEAVRRRHAASIRRIESRSTRPFFAFAEFRDAQTLVFGRAEMALAVIKSGLELGLHNQTICAPDWSPAFEARLKELLDGHRSIDCDARVEFIEPPDRMAWDELAGRFDLATLACNAETDVEWIELAPSLQTRTSAPVASLLVVGNYVLADPIQDSSAAGCAGCLLKYYQARNETPAVPESRVKMCVAIGAGLLLHRLLDLSADIVPIDEQGSFFEIDLQTLGICRRPLSIHSSCGQCARRGELSYTPLWPGAEDRDPFEAEPFLERVHKCIVDPETGLIARIEEGDLLQIPHHQSAALWYRPGDRTRPMWTTEVGDDVLVARLSVIRRVLEQYLAERLARADADHVFPVQTSSGECVTNVSRDDLQSAVLASGTSREELMADALFRALACFAHRLDDWLTVPVSGALPDDDSRLTLGYLDDIGALDSINVESNLQFSVAGFEALSFSFKGKPISVVAGLAGSGAWATGLKDVWLYLTALEANLEPPALSLDIRFRGAGAMTSSVSEVINLLNDRLGVHFAVMPFQCAEVATLQPLIFAYGLVSFAPIGAAAGISDKASQRG